MNVIYGNGYKIAEFQDAQEALMCLPAMSRALGMSLVLKTTEEPATKCQAPHGCSIESMSNSATITYYNELPDQLRFMRYRP